MSTTPYESAYPVPPEAMSEHQGLTKREHFAALALQGILAAGTVRPTHSAEAVVRVAVAYADDLIEALNEEDDSE